MSKPQMQRYDDVVESVLFCRRAYREYTPKQFARWFEARYKVPEARVLAILEHEGGEQINGGS